MTGRTQDGTVASQRWLWAVVAVAVVLRAPRVVLRWDEVALAYSAYAAPTSRALLDGRLGDAVGSWVGLHPPLHALVMALLDAVAPVPLLWLLGSAACSVGAVVLVTRHAGPLAGLLVATAPLQLQDAAEVNNYPLATLGMAALVWGARAPVGRFLLGVALAGWGHVLGLAAAGAVTLWRLARPVEGGERVRIAVGAALVAAPVVGGMVRLSQQGSTFAQPAFELGPWLALVGEAGGPTVWGVSVLVLVGMAVRPGAATVAWVGLALTYGVALLAGSAAPHQRPYLALFGPPAAVAVAGSVDWLRARRPRLARAVVLAVVVLSLGRGAGALRSEFAAVGHLRADLGTPRGIDLALERTGPGDVIWLVAPALQADDDKSDHSPVLWRLPPWRAMPRAPIPGGGAFTDWLWGQPRRVDGRTVHTSTELDPGRFDRVVAAAHASGSVVAVVLYDHAPATGLAERVARTVRIYAPDRRVVPRDAGLGDDYVWVLAPPGADRARP